MIDVKKLTTGFLILAVAASAAALVISNAGNFGGVSNVGAGTADISNTGSGTDNSAGGGTATGANSALSGNAFVPQADNNNASVTLFPDEPSSDADISATTTAAIMDDPNNLTNALANAYMNNLMGANPGGLSTDVNGNPILTTPNNNSVIQQFLSSSSAIEAPSVPDWDAEAAEVPIIITSSSPNQLATYSVAVGEILDQNIVQTNLQSVLTDNTDPTILPSVESDVQTALQDISGLQTPAPMVTFQKNLIKTLVYAKDSITLAENAQIDPVKAALIFQAEDSKYQVAIQDLQSSLQAAKSKNLFSVNTDGGETNSSNVVAFLQFITGAPTAYAQIPVTDAAGDAGIWATVGNMIKAEVQDTVLQLIKNALVFIMQKTIIAGIQGSGAPKFIQQWGTTLANAFTQSAIGALNNQMQCVGAAPFAAQLRLTLNATYQPGNNNVCAVQFNAQLANNLSTFYNNFSNGGGWVTYGATLQPDNNYFMSTYFTAQVVGASAQNGQNAANSKAIAGQGFHGSEVCDDGSNPNSQTLFCTSTSDPNKTQTTQASACPAGYQLSLTLPADGTCMDGTEPEVQTPGAVLNGMVSSAVSGNFSLITSATSWEGLASGLFISILQETLNSLAQTTIAGVNGLLQQAASGDGANSVTSSTSNGVTTYTTTQADAPQPINCYVSADPSGNPLMADILVSGGETIGASGVTTPSYTWQQPDGGTLSTTVGDSVVGTFDATGTIYYVLVTESPDNTTTTCAVPIPAPSD